MRGEKSQKAQKRNHVGVPGVRERLRVDVPVRAARQGRRHGPERFVALDVPMLAAVPAHRLHRHRGDERLGRQMRVRRQSHHRGGRVYIMRAACQRVRARALPT